MGSWQHDGISSIHNQRPNEEVERSFCALGEYDFLLAGLGHFVHPGDEFADAVPDESDASGLGVAAYTDDILEDAVCPCAGVGVDGLTVDEGGIEGTGEDVSVEGERSVVVFVLVLGAAGEGPDGSLLGSGLGGWMESGEEILGGFAECIKH